MDNKSALSKKKISTYFVSKKSTAKSNCISGYSKKGKEEHFKIKI